jgi:hypothetical protein
MQDIEKCLKMKIENYRKTSEKKKLIGDLTCPKCGHKQKMEIPTSTCQAFYKCEGCGKIIMAEKSCCVFCDFGTIKCPAAEEHQKSKSIGD